MAFTRQRVQHLSGGTTGQAGTMLRIAWADWTSQAVQHARLRMRPEGVEMHGSVPATPGQPAMDYALVCDAAWRTRSLDIRWANGQSTSLQSDGAGAWMHDGRPAPELAGALDVDVAATPLTNTLPIRRLRLNVGARATVRCVYVEGPGAVRMDVQHYTRLQPLAYLFEAPGFGFVCQVEVDQDGLVTDYPGLFRRVVAT